MKYIVIGTHFMSIDLWNLQFLGSFHAALSEQGPVSSYAHLSYRGRL